MNLKSCRVRDYMAGSLVTFSPDLDVLDAIQQLLHHRIAGAPVVTAQGELVGMLSELDCLKVALDAGYYGDWGGPVTNFMSPDVQTVDADMNRPRPAVRDLALPPLSGDARQPARRPDQPPGRAARAERPGGRWLNRTRELA